jgi:hypothetical protein
VLWVVLVAPSVVDEAVLSTDPRVSAGDVDPESATAVSLDDETTSPEDFVTVEGSPPTPAVDVVGSVAVPSPDVVEASAGAESSAGAEAESFVEGVASVLVSDEAGSVATAVASEVVLAGWSTVGAASVVDVVGSVEEVAVSVAASVVCCVVAVAASTVVSVLAGAAAGSMSTVGSLKVQSPPFPQTFLHTLLVKMRPPFVLSAM